MRAVGCSVWARLCVSFCSNIAWQEAHCSFLSPMSRSLSLLHPGSYNGFPEVTKALSCLRPQGNASFLLLFRGCGRHFNGLQLRTYERSCVILYFAKLLTVVCLPAAVQCGKRKVWLDPNEVNEIHNANSRQNFRKLIKVCLLSLIVQTSVVSVSCNFGSTGSVSLFSELLVQAFATSLNLCPPPVVLIFLGWICHQEALCYPFSRSREQTPCR